jgi:hypothetical protein
MIKSYAELGMCDPENRIETIEEAIEYLTKLPFIPLPTPP